MQGLTVAGAAAGSHQQWKMPVLVRCTTDATPLAQPCKPGRCTAGTGLRRRQPGAASSGQEDKQTSWQQERAGGGEWAATWGTAPCRGTDRHTSGSWIWLRERWGQPPGAQLHDEIQVGAVGAEAAQLHDVVVRACRVGAAQGPASR